MEMGYIVLTEQFCLDHKDYIYGVNQFGYAITTDGRYVASVNALNDFPELFEGMTLEHVMLSQDDFPPFIFD